jgi:hypothetical protein
MRDAKGIAYFASIIPSLFATDTVRLQQLLEEWYPVQFNWSRVEVREWKLQAIRDNFAIMVYYAPGARGIERYTLNGIEATEAEIVEALEAMLTSMAHRSVNPKHLQNRW